MMRCVPVLALMVMTDAPPVVPAPAPPAVVAADTLPTWAQGRWRAVATATGLDPSSRLTPGVLAGDFDGDGAPDAALFVVRRRDGKQGIVILHRRAQQVFVVGAGRTLGNGGDDFSWADSWRVERGTAHADVLVLERESSASGVIAFRGGRYRWTQRGD